MAYQSAESSGREVFVRPFPDVNEARTQVSAGGGFKPLWAPGGRELFYIDPDGDMLAVPVQTAGRFARDEPRRLFSARVYYFTQVRNYDISRDGQRFLMLKEPPKRTPDRTARRTSTSF